MSTSLPVSIGSIGGALYYPAREARTPIVQRTEGESCAFSGADATGLREHRRGSGDRPLDRT